MNHEDTRWRRGSPRRHIVGGDFIQRPILIAACCAWARVRGPKAFCFEITRNIDDIVNVMSVHPLVDGARLEAATASVASYTLMGSGSRSRGRFEGSQIPPAVQPRCQLRS